jgi:hypothetical protein
LVVVLLLVAVLWANWRQVWRKGVLLWRQRELAGAVFDGGRVVYEPDPVKGRSLIASSPGEYSVDRRGSAAWYPRAWREFPWAGIAGANDYPWTNPLGYSRALVFCGYLKDPSGRSRLVIARAEVLPVIPDADQGEVYVFLFDPETVWRRGSLKVVTGALPFEPTIRMMPGTYRFFSGRAVAGDPSAFEFEYEPEKGGVRRVVRVRLEAGHSVGVTREVKQ